MTGMIKIISSSVGKYTPRSKNVVRSLQKTVKNQLQCITFTCNNRVICRCTICSENLCYEHTKMHIHSMKDFEVIK